MNPLTLVLAWLKSAPKTPEDLAAEQEAARLRAEMETIKDTALGSAGGMYQSQRASTHRDQ